MDDISEKLTRSPCKCCTAWVHMSCLDKWRGVSGYNKCHMSNTVYYYKKRVRPKPKPECNLCTKECCILLTSCTFIATILLI